VKGHTLITAAAIAATLAGGALTGAAPAASGNPLQRAALKALASPRIDAATAARGRAEVRRAVVLARVLPSGRREHVSVALAELASFAGRMTQPRALELVGALKVNDDYFAQHYAPAPKTDITDADGVVYRYFAGRCFEFHPLANFGALNAHIAAGDAEATQQLADALIARGVYQPGGGIAWEYTFPYAGGGAPWLSGMAQAVGAQAFAAAAALVPDEQSAYMREAHAAYRVIPKHLLTSVAAGPWIRLYSFDSLRVLNAQLQAVVSLQSYAVQSEDAEAAALAARMQSAAAATLTSFDTGYWTYYALPSDPSPLDYQQYVVQLLHKLATADPRFADAAMRIGLYEKQPPAFKLDTGSLGALSFWLSKPATVQANSGAGPSRRLTLDAGWHTFDWGEPKRPGIYPVHVTAVDSTGNKASFDALPIVRVVVAKKAPAKKRSIAAAPPATPAPTPALTVGTGLDDVSQGASVLSAGLHVVRVGVTWPSGATTPDPGAVEALQQLPPSLGVVVELNVAPLPVDDAGLAALAQYATSLAQQVPSLRYLVLGPAATTATASPYAVALAVVRQAVQTALPDALVGLAIDGSQNAKATIAALAGTMADVVAFRPAPVPGKGLWTFANLPQLSTALAATFGTAPPVLVDGLAPPFAPAIAAAACTTGLAGVVFDHVADATPPAVASAIGAAQRGATVCPGLATQVSAATLDYPTSLAGPVNVQLACDRDCLYLVTLAGPNGPVAARRGALQGAAAPASITLPKTKLASGAYTISVQLVAQVNPGTLTKLESSPLFVN
jgi:D-glucuronyl C5-epimerase C-terminus